MPTFVLDAGALIAIDRGDRDLMSTLQVAFENGHDVQAPAGAIGQAWRNPKRHALLSRVLKRCDEAPLYGTIARSSGQLCGQTGTSDVIDASVAIAVAAASDEVTLLTSDPGDLRNLLAALHASAEIVKV